MDEVNKIGKISKQWTGLLREAFTDSDNFGIQFPLDLDVRMKAVMIGACFLIVSATLDNAVYKLYFTTNAASAVHTGASVVTLSSCFACVQDFMFFETTN